MKSDEADKIGLAPAALDITPPHVPQAADGRGFFLSGQGQMPVASQNGQMLLEFVSAAVNVASAGAHSGATLAVTIPGLKVGDLCFFIGSAHGAVANRPFIKDTDVVCSTEGQITLHLFNADAGTVDPSSATFYFLVIHRFI